MAALSVLLIWADISDAQKPWVYDCPAGEKYDYVGKAVVRAENNADKTFKSVFAGNGLAFRYVQEFDCPNTFDEEVSIRLIWSVPETDTSFTLRLVHQDSLNSPVCYYINGPGPSRGISLIMRSAEGSIKGKKVNGAWMVDCNLELITLDTKRLTETKFVLSFSHSFTRWRPEKGKGPAVRRF